MSDRATPETDEQINGKPCTRFSIAAGDSLRDALVPSEFARKLERERDEARNLADAFHRDQVTLILERDEAQETAEKWRKLHDAKDELFKKGIAELERERDEARGDATNYYAKIGKLENELNNMQDQRDLAMRVISRLERELGEARGELHNYKCDAVAWEILTKAKHERDRLREAVIKTLDANRHLADGDDCTLAKLKSVVPDWK